MVSAGIFMVQSKSQLSTLLTSLAARLEICALSAMGMAVITKNIKWAKTVP
jgi:hypothetical protein